VTDLAGFAFLAIEAVTGVVLVAFGIRVAVSSR